MTPSRSTRGTRHGSCKNSAFVQLKSCTETDVASSHMTEEERQALQEKAEKDPTAKALDLLPGSLGNEDRRFLIIVVHFRAHFSDEPLHVGLSESSSTHK